MTREQARPRMLMIYAKTHSISQAARGWGACRQWCANRSDCGIMCLPHPLALRGLHPGHISPVVAPASTLEGCGRRLRPSP
jgi:hypothetical protein